MATNFSFYLYNQDSVLTAKIELGTVTYSGFSCRDWTLPINLKYLGLRTQLLLYHLLKYGVKFCMKHSKKYTVGRKGLLIVCNYGSKLQFTEGW